MSHAVLSPSSAERTTACPGSVALCKGLPDTSSAYADDGSVTHAVAADCLTLGDDPAAHVGRVVEFNGKSYTIDHDRAERVRMYVDYVRSLPGQLLVEQRLRIESITGEPDAHGTADAVVLGDDELIIGDLKDGRGVRVEAIENKQLAIYAAAALEQYDYLGFSRVRLAIIQPKLDHISEWDLTVEELREFVGGISRRLARAWEIHNGAELVEGDLNPGEKACKFCRAKATCPALRDAMLATIVDDVVDLDRPLADQIRPALERKTDNAVLGNLLASVDLIEDWCSAIRAEALRQLADGNPVPGFKLVPGKRGARQWKDKAEAEATLKAMRLKVEHMYDLSLISPTTAEKLAKAEVIGPRPWQKLQELITQSEGKPSVAPESDKRQAIQVGPRPDVFSDLTQA